MVNVRNATGWMNGDVKGLTRVVGAGRWNFDSVSISRRVRETARVLGEVSMVTTVVYEDWHSWLVEGRFEKGECENC